MAETYQRPVSKNKNPYSFSAPQGPLGGGVFFFFGGRGGGGGRLDCLNRVSSVTSIQNDLRLSHTNVDMPPNQTKPNLLPYLTYRLLTSNLNALSVSVR